MKYTAIVIIALCLVSTMTQIIGLNNLLTNTVSSVGSGDKLSTSGVLGLGNVVEGISQPVQLVTNTVEAITENPTDLLTNPPLGLLSSQPEDILPNDPLTQQAANPLNILNNVPIEVVTNTLNNVPVAGSVTGSLLGGLDNTNSQTIMTNNLPLVGGVSTLQPTNLLGQTVQNVAGIILDSGAKKCYEKQYQLQGDFIEIGFDFKLLTTLLIRESSIMVNFDNQPIYKIVVGDNGKTIKIPIKTKVTKGQHTLSFCPQGLLTEPLFTGFISNLVINEKQCLPQWGPQLITNGGFQNTRCGGQMCYWKNQNFQTTYISGWYPTPEIKIEKALNFNANLGNTWAVELDASKNTCIRQFLGIKAGRYMIKFDWAARGGTAFQTNGLELRINNYLLKTVSPKDYNLHTETIEFILGADSQIEVKFCGTGTSDSFGTLIDNVKLHLHDECSNFRFNKY